MLEAVAVALLVSAAGNAALASMPDPQEEPEKPEE